MYLRFFVRVQGTAAFHLLGDDNVPTSDDVEDGVFEVESGGSCATRRTAVIKQGLKG